jgi:hypothetical protein
MNDRECESYLIDQIKTKRPKLRVAPRMAHASNKIVNQVANITLDEAQTKDKIKSLYQEEKRYQWWRRVKPNEIPLNDVVSAMDSHGATQYAISCLTFTEKRQKQWAIAIHYREAQKSDESDTESKSHD